MPLKEQLRSTRQCWEAPPRRIIHTLFCKYSAPAAVGISSDNLYLPTEGARKGDMFWVNGARRGRLSG